MSKNILIILGGGRPNGNTHRLAQAFKRGAEDSGHSVTVFSLMAKEVKGCLGCNFCRWGRPCVQKDDFPELAEKIRDADWESLVSYMYRTSALQQRIHVYIH